MDILKWLKFPPLNNMCIVGMRRHFCAYDFLTTVTKDVVHGVHKVVIRSSFGVIQRNYSH